MLFSETAGVWGITTYLEKGRRAYQSNGTLTGIIARLLVLLRFCFWKLPHGPPWEEITIQLWYFSAAVVVHDQIAGVPALIAERGKQAAEIF